MPATNRILICAALTTGLLLQGSSCFGDDHTRLAGTWKLVAFMTEDINNKVRENVSRSRRRDILRLRMPCSCLFISGFANA